METIWATVNKTHPKASEGYVLPLSKIRENQHFKCIRFDDVDFDECEAEEVIDFFTKDPRRTWKEVNFCDCSGPVNAVITIVLELNIVESLALTYTWLDPEEGMSPLLAIGLMLPINTSLTSLAISKTCRAEIGLAEAKCLAFGLRRNTTLKTISLLEDLTSYDDATSSTALLELTKGFEKNKSLESFTLDHYWREPDHTTCLLQALAENPSLRIFSIKSWPSEEALVGLLRSTQAPIQSITCEATISPNLLETIQNHCSTTTTTIALDNFPKCEIQDPAAIHIASILENNSIPALQFLDLSSCGLTETGAMAIASSLLTNSTLTTLVLAQTDIGDRGAQALAYVLGENSSLQHLDLGGNDLTEACIEPFANALHQNSTLQVLDLFGNDLGNGVGRIFDALHPNSTLRELKIAYNAVSDAGAVALASSLKNNCGLCMLDMSGNRIGTEGARSIAEAMQANTTLKVLMFVSAARFIGRSEILEGILLDTLKENCHLECFALCAQDAGSSEEILHMLNYNRGGRHILQDLNFPLPLWPMVLQRADTIMYYRGGEESVGDNRIILADSERPQLSVLYSLLRGSPSLFSRPQYGKH